MALGRATARKGDRDRTEEQFLNELSDVLIVLKRLGDDCTDLGELIDLVELATGDPADGIGPNRAQLKILMNLMAGGAPTGSRRAADDVGPG